MGFGTCSVVELEPQDDLASVQYRLSWLGGGRVVLVLPWDMRFLTRELDFGLLRREAERRQLEIAIVSADPERRHVASGCGFPAFTSAEDAQESTVWKSRPPEQVEPPPHYWWEDNPVLQPRPVRPHAPWFNWIKLGIHAGIFVLVLLILAGSAYVVIPSGTVTLVPASKEFTTIVPVSVDPDAETVGARLPHPYVPVSADHDAETVGARLPRPYVPVSADHDAKMVGARLPRPYVPVSADHDAKMVGARLPRPYPVEGVIPARRVGVEVEGHAEVETTGTMHVAVGQATGAVLFTNLLAQDYVVPANTVVRTSSSSYPIRFRTTADITVPAGGQASVPIEALEERIGNVGAFRINQVEGVAASAVRVINPQPTTGAEASEVRVVTQADYDRAREQLMQQLLDQAYVEMGDLLEPTEVLFRQSLLIVGVPKEAYTHFISEQSDTVGLNMRLLVRGLAVDVDDAEAVAYATLSRRLPPGYVLVDAHFELGEVSEEDIGPGWFTFFVNARGIAAAALDTGAAVALVRGQRVDDARGQLLAEFPLSEEPQIVIWPQWPEWLKWLERLPLLPLRISVQVVPQGQAVSQAF